MAVNSKLAALMEGPDGLTEAQAKFMVSGGTETEGLNLPGDTPAVAQVEPVHDIDDKPPAADAKAPPQPDEDADSPPPPKDSPFYPQWQREKRRRQELQASLKERDDKFAATAAELAAERSKWERLDERMKVFREAMEQPDAAAQAAAQPKPMPDRESDPFGFMQWQADRQEALERRLEQYETRTQERDAAVELTQTFRQDAGQYARTNPDFWESAPGSRDGAYHYLMRSRDTELQAAGYSDPAERLRIITADERDIVSRALHAQQRNPSAPGPAEVLFNLAASRGYQRRPAAPPPPQAQTMTVTNGTGGAAANGMARAGNGAAAPPAAAPTVTSQIESIQRGQAASRSLSSAGGAPPPQGPDLAAIANMGENEYATWVRGLNATQKREYYALIGAVN